MNQRTNGLPVRAEPLSTAAVRGGIDRRAESIDTQPTIVIGVADLRRRTAIERSLEDLGCATRSFADGFRLVGYCADAILDVHNPARPRLIVADSILPGLTGVSVLAGIRDLGWKTPAILLAEETQRSALREVWQRGATALCFLPLDLDQLRAVSAYLLGALDGARGRLPCLPAPRSSRENRRVTVDEAADPPPTRRASP